MARDAVIALALRTQAGRWVWSIAAFLFPSLAVVEHAGAASAVLLYLVETAVALGILSLRLQIAWRASRDEPEARQRLLRTRRGMTGVRTMVVVGLAWGLGLVGVLIVTADQSTTVASLTQRIGPMVGTLLLAAILDTVMAPVRTPAWLETGLAWQASRASIVVVSMLIGGPLAFVFGPSALVWSFLGMRLFADLGGFRASERERIRANMFDAPVDSTVATAAGPKAPPRFSPSHARHGIDDPGRLPD
ncbi:MAG TPA: hypothetical protein VMF13_21190 [Luteitalea sp.]|nr:hypothetical protein [Luteitalea sp.]